MADEPLQIDYYTDVLCIWAYIAQIKVDHIKQEFGSRVRIRYRFLSLFGNNPERIGVGWKDQGGFAGYGAHVRSVALPCTYVEVHPEVWSHNPPQTSLAAHLFIKAVEVLESQGSINPELQAEYQGRTASQEYSWRVREAFFRDLRDVARMDVLHDIARAQELSSELINAAIDSGAAFAALALDIEAKQRLGLEGSPTFVINEGRQKLYGNLGCDVVTANIRGLLDRDAGLPTWR